MSSNEEETESEINSNQKNNSFIYSLLRDKEYINSLYFIKKSITIEKNIEKIYATTRERNFNVIITKYSNISFKYKSIEYSRLKSTTELIEENIVLVENLWLEENNEENILLYNLYISEFTKSTYRNEYNLINLNYYLNSNHTEASFNQNIIIILQLLQKIKSIHTGASFAHLNLTPNDIFFNKNDQRIYLNPPKIIPVSYPSNTSWYSPPEECYIEKNTLEDLESGIKYDIWSVGCILCEMFFLLTPIFQSFSQREKMKKIIDILGVPKIEDIDYMSNQEYSFIQSINENGDKTYNKLKEILWGDNNENNININSVNNNIKKLILEIITKCLCYNRQKRISIDEMINQIDYLCDRYIKEKPMKIDAMNIINKDNLMQLNAPIINISLNPYKSKKNTLNSFNNSNSYNNDNNQNESLNDENNNIENSDLNFNMMKNYDSFISDRYSSVINNNDILEDKIQNLNNKNNNNNANKYNYNKNFSKFGSLSSISSNKNYNTSNRGHLTTITTNNYGHNCSNISEQSVYTNAEINKKLKENEDQEYAKLQNRKFIFILI